MSLPSGPDTLLPEIVNYGTRLLGDADNFSPETVHFQHAFGAYQYVRICGEVASRLGGAKRILDWGSGWGQNAMLLSKYGLDVASYDVRPNYRSLRERHLNVETHLRVGNAPDPLPYEDETFDGVLSCGVLEHVPDDRRSALEIHRVLKKGGCFFIYHLPNRYSMTEWFSKMLDRYHHRRKYTIDGASRLLRECGFEILSARYHHFLPRIIIDTKATRPFIDRHYAAIEKFDAFLSRLPVLRNFCTAIEIVAVK